MKAYISEYSNPFANAALEEAFYKSAIDEPVLLFYVNEPTVVLGRSQNPWMEADVPWCEKNGIHILRRFSGGGAVVHDAGNLNYSFFVPRKDYQQGKYAGIVAEAIGLLGVEDVHVSGQYSIYAGEYKISGSAFAVNGHLAMAHGCILVNSDLARLSRALQMRRNCVFETSTVQSVRAPVMNISEYVPGILPGDVCSAIMAQAEVDDYPQPPPMAPEPEAVARFQAYEWTFGKTPDFVFRRGKEEFSVHQGIISAPEECRGKPFKEYFL